MTWIKQKDTSTNEKFIIEKRSKKTIDLENNIVKNNHLEILYKDKKEFGDNIIKIERWEY